MAFVNITYSEIALFLKRAFRALDPKPGPVIRGEMTYILKLSQNLVILVYTSVHQGAEDAAGLGADAIRVGPMTTRLTPIRRGKFPIVKRTNSWKDTLRETVEDLILEYDHDPSMGSA
jgi:hypothetical protein